MNFRLHLFFLIATLVSAAAIAQDAVVLDKIVAKVGGEVIFQSDIEEQLAVMRERKMTPAFEDKCNIVASLMAQGLLVHYAKIDSVEVSDDEVASEIDRRMDQILGYMNGDRKFFQEFYGQTVTEKREEMREPMKRKLLGDRMRAQILEKVGVTPSEVQAYFNQIPRDSLPYFNAEVELGEIVMFPKVNETERNKALDKIKDIQRQLNEGGDFAGLARKYSDDGSAFEGGELGWTSRGQFVPEFEAAAFQLEPGGRSDIVESEFGFHIIELIDRRGNSIRTRHILVRPRITEEDKAKTRAKLDSVRNLVNLGVFTFANAVAFFGDKRVQSHSNNGRMINPKTSNTFFETGDVDSEIFFAIDTIDVGEITPPLEYRMGAADYFYKIVQLQGRTPPHRANLAQDYNRIQDAARESKKGQAFSDWIEKRVPETYIVVDDEFKDCEALKDWNPQWLEREKN